MPRSPASATHDGARTRVIHRREGKSVTNDNFVHQDDHETTPSSDPANIAPENVTREQGGQFIDDSGTIIRLDDPLENMTDPAADARLVDGDASRINALQVTMDRSGAEFIHAQKAFLTNSGAKQITGTSSKLIQSGVLQLKTDKAEFHQSSAVVANTGSLSVDGGSIVFATAENISLSEGAQVSVMQSRSVKADGDVRAFMLFSKDVSAGGNVTSTLTTASAAVFGAVFGVVVVLLSKVLGRNDG
jgi:hypothetical protein